MFELFRLTERDDPGVLPNTFVAVVVLLSLDIHVIVFVEFAGLLCCGTPLNSDGDNCDCCDSLSLFGISTGVTFGKPV